jgi:hypothetical protein
MLVFPPLLWMVQNTKSPLFIDGDCLCCTRKTLLERWLKIDTTLVNALYYIYILMQDLDIWFGNHSAEEIILLDETRQIFLSSSGFSKAGIRYPTRYNILYTVNTVMRMCLPNVIFESHFAGKDCIKILTSGPLSVLLLHLYFLYSL